MSPSVASPPPIREKAKIARRLRLSLLKEEMEDGLASSRLPLIVAVSGHQS